MKRHGFQDLFGFGRRILSCISITLVIGTPALATVLEYDGDSQLQSDDLKLKLFGLISQNTKQRIAKN